MQLPTSREQGTRGKNQRGPEVQFNSRNLTRCSSKVVTDKDEAPTCASAYKPASPGKVHERQQFGNPSFVVVLDACTGFAHPVLTYTRPHGCLDSADSLQSGQ